MAKANTQPTPLMPHATATWLVDHTGLSFEQIAEFCGLHILEVQAMADDLASSKYTGRDPVHAGELTLEEIEMGQADAEYSLKMHKAPVEVTRTKGPRYTPVSKRQDKPDGIAWILRNHPEVSDAQISKLIGTTRNTIGAIRERSHWNIQNIQPKDPVTLGLCSQRELDAVVAKAAKRAGVSEEDEAPVSTDARSDREKLIEELRAEREANVKAAAQAAQEAEAEAWLAAKREAESKGVAVEPNSAFAAATSAPSEIEETVEADQAVEADETVDAEESIEAIESVEADESDDAIEAAEEPQDGTETGETAPDEDLAEGAAPDDESGENPPA